MNEFTEHNEAHKDKATFEKPPEERGQETFEDIKKDIKPKRSHHKKTGKRGRPARKAKPTEAVPKVEPTVEEGEAVSSACAVTVVETIFTLGQAIGGDEWKPSDNERAYMVDAWGSYFRAKGITDLPPGWAVVIATSAYAIPRLRKPKTQTRMIAGYSKVRAWVRSVFGRKEDTGEVPRAVDEK